MNTPRKNIAILLFARTSVGESLAKTVLKNENKNKKLFKHLNSKILSTIKDTQLTSFWSNEHSQQGASFGERLTSCMASIFEKGFDHVIVLGNDCPSLSADEILTASNHLIRNQVVMGADNRGGAYLLGISKNTFKKGEFRRLDWQSASFAASFQEYAERSSFNLIRLGEKPDLNDIIDLQRNILICPWLREKIREIFDQAEGFVPINVLSNSFLNSSSLLKRGPPNRV